MPSAQAAATPEAGASGRVGRRWWPLAKKLLTFAFLAAVLVLLVHQARGIDWNDVGSAVLRLPKLNLLAAAALAALSFFIYSCFDELGRRYAGHGLTRRQCMSIAFVSYAFNLNMGSLIGGIGFRFRLYSKLGLAKGLITRVLVLSLVTNWLGYLCLAGIAFSLRLLEVPPAWKIDAAALQGLGFGFLAVVVAYLAFCAFSKRREWTVRGHELTLPSTGIALAQLGLSMANWLTMACIVFLLLPEKAAFVTVLCVLMVAAVAGVVAHVPAGLGVLEAVFVALLGGEVRESELLAALLAYRAIYYLAPLAVATVVYLGMEARAKKPRLEEAANQISS